MLHYITFALIGILAGVLIYQNQKINKLKCYVDADRIRQDEYLKLLKEYKDDSHSVLNTCNAEISGLRNWLTETDQKVSDLTKGIVPDYEKAVEAKKALDKFNDSVSIITGFDPMDAIRSRRSGGE